MKPYRTLICDASFSREEQIAAIAVVEGGDSPARGQLLVGDLLHVRNTTEAESHAIMRACAILAGRQETGAHIFTDCEQAIRWANLADPSGNPVAADLQAMLRARQATLRNVDRGTVKLAHAAAYKLRLAWLAGKRLETTYRPRRYLSTKR